MIYIISNTMYSDNEKFLNQIKQIKSKNFLNRILINVIYCYNILICTNCCITIGENNE